MSHHEANPYGVDGYDATTYGESFAAVYDQWYSDLDDADFLESIVSSLPLSLFACLSSVSAPDDSWCNGCPYGRRPTTPSLVLIHRRQCCRLRKKRTSLLLSHSYKATSLNNYQPARLMLSSSDTTLCSTCQTRQPFIPASETLHTPLLRLGRCISTPSFRIQQKPQHMNPCKPWPRGKKYSPPATMTPPLSESQAHSLTLVLNTVHTFGHGLFVTSPHPNSM